MAISLVERQIPHKKNVIDLQDKPPLFKELYENACADPTMSAKVPLLETDDRGDGTGDVLIESMVILEYLEEISAEEIGAKEPLPSSAFSSLQPQARVQARVFAQIAPNWLSAINVLKAEPGSEAEAAAVAKLRAGLRSMDAFLVAHSVGSGPFLLGEFSFAEAAVAPFAQRLAILLPGLRSELTDGPGSPLDAWLAEDGLTRLKSWLEAVVTRPSCVDSLPPPEEVVSGYTKLLERIKAMASK